VEVDYNYVTNQASQELFKAVNTTNRMGLWRKY